jgi:hypothetical protein
MILPQLEKDRHGAEVVGMMVFGDNTFLLRKGGSDGGALKRSLTLCGVDPPSEPGV